MSTGATVEGRLLASIAAVTLDAVTVTHPGYPNIVINNGVKNPQEFALMQNYPNPFNPSTHIAFFVPRQSNVNILVFDMLGRKVTTLVNHDLNAGHYSTAWTASQIDSGIYLIRMVSKGFTATRKVVLVK